MLFFLDPGLHVLYRESMTQSERNLLLMLAKQRVTELQMVVGMVDQELANPNMPEQQKAFLVMQRAQSAASIQEIGGAITTIQRESRLVVGK